ncbi:MAG: hypothetical protein J0I12_34790 [Candidatus Eremiobacteraeota bacterium]|nr:hypothetical protein [Candidatus Eremiobacteraeota bacterium]
MRRHWDWILIASLVACYALWHAPARVDYRQKLIQIRRDVRVALESLQWRDDMVDLDWQPDFQDLSLTTWGPHRHLLPHLVAGLAARRGWRMRPSTQPSTKQIRMQDLLDLAVGPNQAILLVDYNQAWMLTNYQSHEKHPEPFRKLFR